MTTDPPKDVPAAPDASDVVTGPVGSASLRDPASSGPEGARLHRLPVIDPDADEPDGAALVPSRPDDGSSGNGPNAAIRQLEAIIQKLTTFATPVLREIAARPPSSRPVQVTWPVRWPQSGRSDRGGRRAPRGEGSRDCVWAPR